MTKVSCKIKCGDFYKITQQNREENFFSVLKWMSLKSYLKDYLNFELDEDIRGYSFTEPYLDIDFGHFLRNYG